MNKKFTALMVGAALVSSTTAFAAEDTDNNKTEMTKESKVVATVVDPQLQDDTDGEMTDFLVGGIVRDVAQKVLPISIEARYFAPHFNAKVKSDSIRYNGGQVGLKDNLGFGNDKAPELIFRYKRLTADYIHVHGTGNTNLNNDTLKFEGVNFDGRVRSQSDFHYLKLNVSNPIVSVLGSGVDWSYGLTGMYWKGKVKGNEANTGLSASKSKGYGAPIPTIGIGAHASLLPSLSVYANASGLPLGGYGHYYDLEAGLLYTPLEILGVTVGFRRIDVKLKHDDDSAKLKLNGPYAGLRVDL